MTKALQIPWSRDSPQEKENEKEEKRERTSGEDLLSGSLRERKMSSVRKGLKMKEEDSRDASQVDWPDPKQNTEERKKGKAIKGKRGMYTTPLRLHAILPRERRVRTACVVAGNCMQGHVHTSAYMAPGVYIYVQDRHQEVWRCGGVVLALESPHVCYSLTSLSSPVQQGGISSSAASGSLLAYSRSGHLSLRPA